VVLLINNCLIICCWQTGVSLKAGELNVWASEVCTCVCVYVCVCARKR
jgi:hypothetical protein